jgi:hypothetical protein
MVLTKLTLNSSEERANIRPSLEKEEGKEVDRVVAKQSSQSLNSKLEEL